MYSQIQDNGILKIINYAIKDWLSQNDCGAVNVWRDNKGKLLVDIEWNDGLSSFEYTKLYNKILEKGKISKDDLWECS